MKNIFLLAIVLFATTSSFSQSVAVAPPSEHKEFEPIFTKVEKEAKFPGGLDGWRKYLEGNLKANLAADFIPLKKKQKLAQRTVSVQFLVGKDGKISEVRAIHRPQDPEVHPVLIQEAVRVIRQGPDWIPAEQNNRKVIYQAIQNITFMVARD
jgi:protein TonB